MVKLILTLYKYYLQKNLYYSKIIKKATATSFVQDSIFYFTKESKKLYLAAVDTQYNF